MKAIEIISIPVTDQEAAKQFYLQIGFNVVTEAPFENYKWIQMALPGQESVSITLVTWFPELKPGSIRGLVIKTDDLETECERLKAAGIAVGDIDKTPWGKFATVKDPDGNALSLHG